MEPVDFIEEDGTVQHIYVAYIDYAGGEEFKIRKDCEWTVDYGGTFETSPYTVDLSEDGYFGFDAVSKGANISVDVSSFPDYCGTLAIAFLPEEPRIVVADAELFQQIISGEWDPSEEPESLSVSAMMTSIALSLDASSEKTPNLRPSA